MKNIETFKQLVITALKDEGIEYKSVNNIDCDPRGIVVDPVDKEFPINIQDNVRCNMYYWLKKLSKEFDEDDYHIFVDYAGRLTVWEFKDFFNEIPKDCADFFAIPWCRRSKPTKRIKEKMMEQTISYYHYH